MCMLTKEFVLGFLRVKEESPRVKLGSSRSKEGFVLPARRISCNWFYATYILSRWSSDMHACILGHSCHVSHFVRDAANFTAVVLFWYAIQYVCARPIKMAI